MMVASVDFTEMSLSELDKVIAAAAEHRADRASIEIFEHLRLLDELADGLAVMPEDVKTSIRAKAKDILGQYVPATAKVGGKAPRSAKGSSKLMVDLPVESCISYLKKNEHTSEKTATKKLVLEEALLKQSEGFKQADWDSFKVNHLETTGKGRGLMIWLKEQK